MTDSLETAMEHEWTAQLALAKATLAVDQLGEFPKFPLGS